MSIIPCAESCRHQADGYCMLEKTAAVTNTRGGCPHKEAPAAVKRPPGNPGGGVGGQGPPALC